MVFPARTKNFERMKGMTKLNKPLALLVGCTIVVFALVGCGSKKQVPTAQQTSVSNSLPTTTQTSNLPATGNQSPAAPETNPTGDIPDSQAFITYAPSTSNYQMEIPEGWAISKTGDTVKFEDKLDGVQITTTNASVQPTVSSVESNQVAALKNNGKAVNVISIGKVKQPGGSAVLIVYDSNSDVNPVTGKEVRLENNCYIFYKTGKLATVTLWAPKGADNVDQWNRMAGSFRWK